MTTDQIMTAYGTVVLAGATVLLVLVTGVLALAAWMQLPMLSQQIRDVSKQLETAGRAEEATQRRHDDNRNYDRQKQLEIETLRICYQLDTDPVLYAASKRIWDASGGGITYRSNPKIDVHDVITCANFIDGIAIGVIQGVYSSEIAKDHVGPFVKKYTEVIVPGVFNKFDDYEAIREFWCRRDGRIVP